MTSPQEELTSLMNAGKEYLSNNNYISAEINFEKVIERAPLFPAAYLNCATVQFFQGKNAEALVNLDIAIALLPQCEDLTAAYHNRALVHVELDHIHESICDLKISMALGFEASEEELKRVRKIQDQKDVSSSDNPNNPENISIKAQSLCDQARDVYSKNPLYSLALFKKALDLNPDSVHALHGMGLANTALGRNDQALECFNNALDRIQPEHSGLKAEVLYNRSALLKEKGELNQAILDLDECLSLALDVKVRFPVMGSPEKEAILIKSIRDELSDWKKESN